MAFFLTTEALEPFTTTTWKALSFNLCFCWMEDGYDYGIKCLCKNIGDGLEKRAAKIVRKITLRGYPNAIAFVFEYMYITLCSHHESQITLG